MNTTHMHLLTHTKPESMGQAGAGSPPTTTPCSTTTSRSARLLDLLDQLGIAENTVVMYSTDNGPHMIMDRRSDDPLP